MLYYFFVLIFKSLLKIIVFVLWIIWKVLVIVGSLLLFVIKLIVGIFLGIYLLFRSCFPEHGKTPFANSNRISHIENIYRIGDLPYTLYLDLSNGLLLFQERKPQSGSYEKIVVNQFGCTQKVYYLQKRPFFEEFIEEVN